MITRIDTHVDAYSRARDRPGPMSQTIVVEAEIPYGTKTEQQILDELADEIRNYRRPRAAELPLTRLDREVSEVQQAAM